MKILPFRFPPKPTRPGMQFWPAIGGVAFATAIRSLNSGFSILDAVIAGLGLFCCWLLIRYTNLLYERTYERRDEPE